jgi:hypothetical protein
MSMFVVLVFLTGALLGMRFKVLVLIPAIGLAVIAVLWIGILRGDNASIVFIWAMLAGSCLQIGYLCGIALARIRHPRKVSLQTNPSSRTPVRVALRSLTAPDRHRPNSAGRP